MLKNHILLILFSFVIVFFVNESFAQSEEIPLADSIYLWVPEKMIQGEFYEGIIVLNEATNNGDIALISSSNEDIVKVESSIFVNKHSNHGIFEIIPKDEGVAEIFVSINGELSSRQVQVYSQKSGIQSLVLFLPANSTNANEMAAYVFALDGNGAPVQVKNNTTVKITSTNGVDAVQDVTIKQNDFYTKFLTHVKGDGTLSVSGKNLKSDQVDITKIQEDIDVKFAIAPNIIASDSFAYYYVWLEQNGSPFNIPGVVDVLLHSTNPKVARLTLIPPQYQNDNIINISLKNGVGKGILYTGQDGHATVTASMARFGSASTDVVVGPAILGSQAATETEERKLEEFNKKYGEGEFIPKNPNSALLWIYPSLTSEKAWGVAALYFSNSTETIDIKVDDKGSQISTISEQSELYPMITDGRSVTVSSNAGLEHDSVYEMTEHGLKTHAIEFEIIGISNGIYDVEISGTGIKMATASVEIKTSDENEYYVNVVPLPTQTDKPQALAIISIVDSDGNLVDVKDTFGKNVIVDVSATSARLSDDKVIIGKGNSGEVNGILTGTSILSVTSDNLGLKDTVLYPAGIASSLELLVPSFVHVGEKFPFVIHQMDSLGIPLEKTIAGFSSSLGIRTVDEYYFILNTQGTEKISTLSNIGADQKEIESFSNPMDFSINVDKTLIRVGEDVIVKIFSTVSDAVYSITSPFPYEQTGKDEFTLTPDTEIKNAEITISAKKDGYESKTDMVMITSERIVTLEIDAISDDDKKQRVSYDFDDGEITSSQTPKIYNLKPNQITITFPQKHSSSEGGYEFQNISVNDKIQNENVLSIFTDVNYEIIANYQSQVQITVIDGQGGGVYLYNETASITAPEKQKISFLVREVFDHWEGIDENDKSFSIIADKDILVTAVYRDDYSYLMIVIFGAVLGVGGFIIKKGNSGYAYKIKDVIDGVLSKAKKLTDMKPPSIPKRKKKKKTD